MTNDQVNEKLTLILSAVHTRLIFFKGMTDDDLIKEAAYHVGIDDAEQAITEIIFEAMEEINEGK